MDAAVDNDFTPGRVVRLTARVARVTAPNRGMMTGPGTNSYVIGDPLGTDAAILDAGPAHPAHVEALVAALGGRRLAALVVTHTHVDHSPAVAPLAERFGAPRVGKLCVHREYQDLTFASDLAVEDGTRVSGDGWTLVAIPTPGHASNHLCWHLIEEGVVFTGDHVLGTTSPVILAPDGSMRAYLDSVARLAAMTITELLPGHGPRLSNPAHVLAQLLRHRYEREAEVVRALEALPGATVRELTEVVYRQIPSALKRWAAHSLEAHLIKLAEDGLATDTAGRWRLVESAHG